MTASAAERRTEGPINSYQYTVLCELSRVLEEKIWWSSGGIGVVSSCREVFTVGHGQCAMVQIVLTG